MPCPMTRVKVQERMVKERQVVECTLHLVIYVPKLPNLEAKSGKSRREAKSGSLFCGLQACSPKN